MKEFLKSTIGEKLKETALHFPLRTALKSERETLSYRELDLITDRIAANLLGLGLKAGDKVLLVDDNSLRGISFFYALQKIRVIPVLTGPKILPGALQNLIDLVQSDYLAMGSGKHALELMDQIRLNKTDLKSRLVFSLGYEGYPGQVDYCSLIREPREVDRKHLERVFRQADPDDTSSILFTSGTTGVPKGVKTSHFSWLNSGYFQAIDLEASEKDVFCSVLPMYHCFGLSTNIIAAMTIGASVVLPEDRSPRGILNVIERHGCTILNAVPTVFYRILTSGNYRKNDLSSLRTGIIGGSGCSPSFFRGIEKSLGMTLLSSLGMTEATAGITVSTMNDSLELRSSSVGRFMDCVEGAILDPRTGDLLLPGQVGEICMKGYLQMQGYYGAPALTAEVIDQNGWLHTGDLGYMDHQGYLYLKGRIKELIIKGGENICPCEVEKVLLENNKVAEAKVIGVPDLHYGEELYAFIVPQQNQELKLEEISAYTRERLIRFKIPRYFSIVGNLPKNTIGKIQVDHLRETAVRNLESAENKKLRYYE